MMVYERPHKHVQAEEAIARGRGMLECLPPAFVFHFAFGIVEQGHVDVAAIGDRVVRGLLKIAVLDPTALCNGAEGVVVCGKQYGINFIENAVRDLKPEHRVLGVSEQLKKNKHKHRMMTKALTSCLWSRRFSTLSSLVS